MTLQGKVALITGGGRGVGAATARLLAARGAKVIVNYLRNTATAEQVVAEIIAAGGVARTVQANVQDAQQVAHLVAEAQAVYGHIDILVSNAPTSFFPNSLLKMTWEQFSQPVVEELKAAFELTKTVVPSMLERRYGRLIYVASNMAKRPSFPGGIAISTSKASLVAFVKYVAQEFGPYGITANTVSPSMVETDLSSGMPAQAKQQAAAMTPLGRIAQPEDIARVIAFFADDDSGFMTGTYAPVNGGQYME